MRETEFLVGEDNFDDLRIDSKLGDNFHWFYHSERGLITRFVLGESVEVYHVCDVTLIKNEGEKFTPRIHFSVRHKDEPKNFAETKLENTEDALFVKASVNIGDCHKNFWDLISYLQSMTQLDIPDESFTLVTKDVARIVNALTKRDLPTIMNIMRMLSSTPGLNFSEKDINVFLKRKERLSAFSTALGAHHKEGPWQSFFEQNKWIFGYGLNYVILKVQEQPYVGGKQFDRKGGQNPDFLGITSGEVRFTVLVEIKTPDTPLLQGEEEIRNGAWSLSKDFTDALVQTQANIDRWNREGARTDENRDKLEKEGIFTVKPKGILLIGCLAEVKNDLHKLQTFERFRKSIHDVEIITFDELYERGRFIVDHTT